MQNRGKLQVTVSRRERQAPSVSGTSSAFLRRVILYEVLSNGYHTPLTKNQIGELFHAGRLTRSHRCKPTTAKEWRTIDELFPLLKYQSSWPAEYCSVEDTTVPRTNWQLALLFLALVTAGIFFWNYLASTPATPTQTARVTARDWPRTLGQEPSPASVSAPPAQTDAAASNPPLASYFSETGVNLQQKTQLAEQRRQAEEQRARLEAQNRLGRERLIAQSVATEQKAAFQDAVIPLDLDTLVNVGGFGVSVRIHDNDVTSFDVWIDGVRRREVPKQKGITGSGTDETFIYASGRAHLYYVWEPSGKVNHCRLRVREN